MVLLSKSHLARTVKIHFLENYVWTLSLFHPTNNLLLRHVRHCRFLYSSLWFYAVTSVRENSNLTILVSNQVLFFHNNYKIDIKFIFEWLFLILTNFPIHFCITMMPRTRAGQRVFKSFMTCRYARVF